MARRNRPTRYRKNAFPPAENSPGYHPFIFRSNPTKFAKKLVGMQLARALRKKNGENEESRKTNKENIAQRREEIKRLYDSIQKSDEHTFIRPFIDSGERKEFIKTTNQALQIIRRGEISGKVMNALSTEHLELGDIQSPFESIMRMHDVVIESRERTNQIGQHAVAKIFEGIVAAALTEAAYRVFHARGIRTTRKRILDKIMPTPRTDLSDLISFNDAGVTLDYSAISKKIHSIERDIILENKKMRKAAGHSRAKMVFVKKALARLPLSRTDKKTVRRDALAWVAVGNKDYLKGAVKLAFKKGRIRLSEKLKLLGYKDPQSVIRQLHLSEPTKGGYRRLSQLLHALHGKTESQQKQMMNHYLASISVPKPVEYSTSTIPTESRKPTLINPIKAAKKAERLERAAKKGEEKLPRPPKEKKMLPSTLGGYLSLFKNTTLVSDEMVNGLSSLLGKIDLKKEPSAGVDHAVEHLVLSILATRFQKGGRVSQTALREIAVSQRLHEHFTRAIESLYKKDLIEYEAHHGRNDNISIPDAVWNKLSGKYNTKLHRQRNGE